MKKADPLVKMGLINHRHGFAVQQAVSKGDQSIDWIIRRPFDPFVHDKIFRQKILKAAVKPLPDFALGLQNLLDILCFAEPIRQVMPDPVNGRLDVFFIMLIIMIQQFIDILSNAAYDGLRNA